MTGLIWFAMACVRLGPSGGPSVDGAVASIHQRRGRTVKRMPSIAFRPVEPESEVAQWATEAVSRSRWDAGLAAAAGELIGTLRTMDRLMSPSAMALATARAGYPGAARFGKTVTNGDWPTQLVESISASAVGREVDIGVARRDFGNGRVLWVVGWAPRLTEMDPVPRTVALDASVMVRIDRIKKGDARLFIAPPDGPVRELSMTDGVARWVDGFDVPGEYRFEVVTDDGGVGELALLFSVFADQQPHAMPPARPAPTRPPDPQVAERWLFDTLNQLRQDHGLKPVSRFPLFDQLTRAHSALMGHTGIVAHSLPGQGTVEQAAAALAHPRAEHFQNVAAAPTAQDAMEMVALSPAHLKNLLCESCTHVSIGASLEPVLDRIPRLFVTWELLEFPQGPPREIDDYNR